MLQGNALEDQNSGDDEPASSKSKKPTKRQGSNPDSKKELDPEKVEAKALCIANDTHPLYCVVRMG